MFTSRLLSDKVLLLIEMLLILHTVICVGSELSPQDADKAVTSNETTLIVMSAPSVNNSYYEAVFPQIIDYMINFANILQGKDDVVIVVDDATMPYFKGKVPDNVLIEAWVDDIWIRDFGLVIPSRGIKFRYVPNYQVSLVTTLADKSFLMWLCQNNMQYTKKSRIVLDGGNVVDTPDGKRAILTDRILLDNPDLNITAAKAQLKYLLGVDEVAIISEVPYDTTGHSDGMLMWVSNDKILFTQTDEPERTEILDELRTSFPGVTIQEIPSYFRDGNWKNFTSACNVYVNSIVTDQFIYMPTFNTLNDTSMAQLIQSQTTKTVVPVPAEKVCFMGGSVRCLSWQVKGDLRKKILKLTGR